MNALFNVLHIYLIICLYNQNLHHHMTKREIEDFFDVDDHDKGNKNLQKVEVIVPSSVKGTIVQSRLPPPPPPPIYKPPRLRAHQPVNRKIFRL